MSWLGACVARTSRTRPPKAGRGVGALSLVVASSTQYSSSASGMGICCCVVEHVLCESVFVLVLLAERVCVMSSSAREGSDGGRAGGRSAFLLQISNLKL